MPDPTISKYVIIPKTDVETDGEPTNMEMLNSSVSCCWAQVRKNADGTKYLFEMRASHDEVFLPYQWYTREEIRAELAKAEWTVE